MTRAQAQAQAAAAIALCERVGPILKTLGEVETVTDAEIERRFADEDERTAAKWLRDVARNSRKTNDS